MNIAWSDENKSATLNMNYVSGYKNVLDDIDSYKTIDAQYTVILDSDGDADSIKLSFGIKNLLDEEPPRVLDGANYSYDAKQHSPLGRSLYLKAKFQF